MRILPIELLHQTADGCPLVRVPTRRPVVREYRPRNRKKTNKHRKNCQPSALHSEPSRWDVLERTLIFPRNFVKHRGGEILARGCPVLAVCARAGVCSFGPGPHKSANKDQFGSVPSHRLNRMRNYSKAILSAGTRGHVSPGSCACTRASHFFLTPDIEVVELLFPELGAGFGRQDQRDCSIAKHVASRPVELLRASH